MEDSLQTSFWVMILVQTIGSVDMPGRGPRKLPAPRQYVAILITWLVLQLISGMSAAAAKATAAIGWTLVLTGIVIGPFGRQVVNLFTIIATQFSSSGSATGQAVQQAASKSGVRPADVSSLTPFPPTGTTLK